jgi:hypothetical protein
MKISLLLLLGSLLLTGCTTTSISSRRQERLGSYNTLTAEQRLAVDIGQIKIGMSEDAVYIALGKPSQILRGESTAGSIVTWLYTGTYFEEYRGWGYYGYNHCYRGRFYTAPYMTYDYVPRGYVRVEVTFENGTVKEWRSLPRPGY